MSTWHYQKNKERLQKQVHEWYQNLSEEEKIKKQKHGCQEWLVKYRKSYSKEIQKLKLADSFIDSSRSLHEV